MSITKSTVSNKTLISKQKMTLFISGRF